MSTLLLALAAAILPPDTSLSIGGLTLGQSEVAVVRALGAPSSRTEGGSDYLPVELSYPGITVLLDEQGVGGVISTGKAFCTPAGVCPGTPVAEALRLYGEAWVTQRVDGSPVGYVYDEGCWLEFALASGHVQRIELACMP